MSWFLIDSKGFVGDLASITGLANMREACAGTPVDPFFETGTSDDPVALRREVAKIKVDDPDVQDTLDNLVDLLGKAEGVVMISDGLEEYEDEEDIGE